MAKKDQFEEVNVDLSGKRDAVLCSAGVEKYCKRIEDKLATEAGRLHRSEEKKYRDEVAGLREELVEPLKNGGARILPHHRPVLKEGLKLLVTHQRGVAGPLEHSLAEPEMAETIRARASHVEDKLIPQFDDQLPLEQSTPDPTGTNEAGESLTDIAKREAEEAEKPAKKAKRSKKKSPLKVEK